MILQIKKVHKKAGSAAAKTRKDTENDDRKPHFSVKRERSCVLKNFENTVRI